MRRFVPPPMAAPVPAIMSLKCPWCESPQVALVGANLVSPDPLPADAAPTPEQLQALANGYQVQMQHTCAHGHAWMACVIQKPEGPAVMALFDLAGRLLELGEIAARARATARIVVPGRA